MSQEPNTVLIHNPGNRTYNLAMSVSESAKELCEYAVLSENVYTDGSSVPSPRTGRQQPSSITSSRNAEQLEKYSEACAPEGGYHCPGGLSGTISLPKHCATKPATLDSIWKSGKRPYHLSW